MLWSDKWDCSEDSDYNYGDFCRDLYYPIPRSVLVFITVYRNGNIVQNMFGAYPTTHFLMEDFSERKPGDFIEVYSDGEDLIKLVKSTDDEGPKEKITIYRALRKGFPETIGFYKCVLAEIGEKGRISHELMDKYGIPLGEVVFTLFNKVFEDFDDAVKYINNEFEKKPIDFGDEDFKFLESYSLSDQDKRERLKKFLDDVKLV